MIDNFFGLFTVLLWAPAMTFEKIGYAGHGVGMIEHINDSVVVAVLAVCHYAGWHKLSNTHRAGKRARN